MAIQSISEFEAILSRIMMKIDKELVVRTSAPKLEEARRTVERANHLARDAAKLKAFKNELLSAGDTLREEIPRDQELGEMTWDLIDYIDYRLS